MNFGFPPVKGTIEAKKGPGLTLGQSGVHDSLSFGIRKVRDNLEICHPLEMPEKNYSLKEEQLHLAALRNNQGLHAPFRILAELDATKKVRRLPFLPSSGLSEATIKNSDDYIDFTDFLNHPEMEERPLVPHATVERSLGIL